MQEAVRTEWLCARKSVLVCIWHILYYIGIGIKAIVTQCPSSPRVGIECTTLERARKPLIAWRAQKFVD